MSINTLLTNPTIMSGIVGDIYQYTIPEGTQIQRGTSFDGITISNNNLGDIYKVDINITVVYTYPATEPPPGQIQCIIIAYNGQPINGNFIPASIAKCDIQSANFINVNSSFVYVSNSNSPLQITFQASTTDNLPYLFVYSGVMVIHHLPNSNFHQS